MMFKVYKYGHQQHYNHHTVISSFVSVQS